MIVGRDKCVCRETTAGNSTKPRMVVHSLISVEQGVLNFVPGY